jgi:hypothetical protein
MKQIAKGKITTHRELWTEFPVPNFQMGASALKYFFNEKGDQISGNLHADSSYDI